MYKFNPKASYRPNNDHPEVIEDLARQTTTVKSTGESFPAQFKDRVLSEYRVCTDNCHGGFAAGSSASIEHNRFLKGDMNL